MVHSAPRLHQSKLRSPHTHTFRPRVALAGCGGALALTYGGSLGCAHDVERWIEFGRFVSMCTMPLCLYDSLPVKVRTRAYLLCAPAEPAPVVPITGTLSRMRRLDAARAPRARMFVRACARHRLAPPPWRVAPRVSACLARLTMMWLAMFATRSIFAAPLGRFKRMVALAAVLEAFSRPSSRPSPRTTARGALARPRAPPARSARSPRHAHALTNLI